MEPYLFFFFEENFDSFYESDTFLQTCKVSRENYLANVIAHPCFKINDEKWLRSDVKNHVIEIGQTLVPMPDLRKPLPLCRFGIIKHQFGRYLHVFCHNSTSNIIPDFADWKDFFGYYRSFSAHCYYCERKIFL